MNSGGSIESSTCKASWRLNQKSGSAAQKLPETEFAERFDASALRLLETRNDRLVAFALGMTSRNPLPDFSLLWFVTRFEDFLFLERLVVEPGVRRAGIASALLERVLQVCREEGLTSVCCQVHDRPANREAQAFVLARGFRAIESVMLPSRDIVTMYQRSTATATP